MPPAVASCPELARLDSSVLLLGVGVGEKGGESLSRRMGKGLRVGEQQFPWKLEPATRHRN